MNRIEAEQLSFFIFGLLIFNQPFQFLIIYIFFLYYFCYLLAYFGYFPLRSTTQWAKSRPPARPNLVHVGLINLKVDLHLARIQYKHTMRESWNAECQKLLVICCRWNHWKVTYKIIKSSNNLFPVNQFSSIRAIGNEF